MSKTNARGAAPDGGALPEGERLRLLRSVVDTFFEPSLLVRPSGDDQRPERRLLVLSSNVAAVDLLAPTPGDRRLEGRALAELMPWAGPSGLGEALGDVVDTGTPLRIHDHAYEDASEPGGRVSPRSVSVGAVRIGPGLLLVTLRPNRGTAGTDPAWEEKLHRLAGTGPWEWDVRAGLVYWYAQALAVLGSSAPPGPAPVDQPPYRVHHEDVAEHDAFLRSLARSGGGPGHVEVRVLPSTGVVRHIRFGGEPIPDQAGDVARVYGTVQDVTVRRRAQTALEIAQVQLAARRTRADSERQLTGLLQQVIMPTGPVPEDVPGLEVAARYRPASAASGVGGDWYGVTVLPDGRVLLYVGDVAGHGFPAATAMARLYHALQGLAVTGAGPARLMHWLNVLTCGLSEFTLASACCAVFDPVARRLVLANAGHPSPVFVRGGAAAALSKPANGLLGLDPGTGYDEHEVGLEPGDVLLLYTDGLVERRRQSPDEDTSHLLRQAADPPADLEQYADRILRTARSDTDDDACLVVVRFR
jgi:serine phosphatase RsbU (regulator of sigma subunit)/PAS domain-containing protein